MAALAFSVEPVLEFTEAGGQTILAPQTVPRCGVRDALVTLEYTPGCDRPMGISALLDGREEGDSLLRRLGDPEVRNQAVWEKYAA